jgi:hypothetical protein
MHPILFDSSIYIFGATHGGGCGADAETASCRRTGVAKFGRARRTVCWCEPAGSACG